MSHERLLSAPSRDDLGLVTDLVDATVLRLKVALVKRCGGDVLVRPEAPSVKQLRELLRPVDELAIGAAAPFTLSAQNLRGLVILDVPLVQRLVGLFLGEDPSADAAPEPRRLTQLDLQMARSICNDIVQSLISACTVMPLTAVVGDVHSNPRSVTSLPQSPAVVEIDMELGPEEGPYGRAQLVLPAQAAGVLWPERQAKPKKKKRKRSMKRVSEVAVPVVAELVRRKMTLADVRELQVGDLIELGSMHDVTVRLGGRPSLEGEAGHQQGLRCVRIKRRLGPQGPAGTDR